jgi:hypothetical protein
VLCSKGNYLKQFHYYIAQLYMQAVCLQINHCKHENSSFIYVVFGPEKLVYFIVHNMSVKIIF